APDGELVVDLPEEHPTALDVEVAPARCLALVDDHRVALVVYGDVRVLLVGRGGGDDLGVPDRVPVLLIPLDIDISLRGPALDLVDDVELPVGCHRDGRVRLDGAETGDRERAVAGDGGARAGLDGIPLGKDVDIGRVVLQAIGDDEGEVGGGHAR